MTVTLDSTQVVHGPDADLALLTEWGMTAWNVIDWAVRQDVFASTHANVPETVITDPEVLSVILRLAVMPENAWAATGLRGLIPRHPTCTKQVAHDCWRAGFADARSLAARPDTSADVLHDITGVCLQSRPSPRLATPSGINRTLATAHTVSHEHLSDEDAVEWARAAVTRPGDPLHRDTVIPRLLAEDFLARHRLPDDVYARLVMLAAAR